VLSGFHGLWFEADIFLLFFLQYDLFTPCVLNDFLPSQEGKRKNAPWATGRLFPQGFEDRIKELEHLAVYSERSSGDLIEESTQNLIKKYEKKPKKITFD